MGAPLQTAFLNADIYGMGIAEQLRDKATRGLSGHLDIVSARLSGQVWLREGRICTVSLSSPTPALGMRLVSGGKLSLSSLGTALTAQQKNPQMRLGDVLVRMGLVTRQDVEAVAWEQMCDGVATLMGLTDAAVTFTQVPLTVCPPPGPAVDEVISAAQTRESRWQDIVRQVGGSDTVPSLTDALLQTRDTTLRPEEWAVLCRVDGRKTLASIASQAGFNTLEAASILHGLVAAGLVSVPTIAVQVPPPAPEAPAVTPEVTPAAVAAPAAQSGWGATPDLFDDPSDLLRELSELGSSDMTGRRFTH